MSNTLFHNKFHLTNHHTVSTFGYPDSGIDPIASKVLPFCGIFYNKFITGFREISTNSFEWASTYTTLCSNSATYYLFPTTFSSVNSLSNNWDRGNSFYVSYLPVSGSLHSSYITTNTLSSTWPFANTTLRTNFAQENIASKNFAGVTLYPSIISSSMYLDYVTLGGPTINLPVSSFYSVFRSSSATFINSQGNLVYSNSAFPGRINYSLNEQTKQWEVQGLLIEESRTNSIIYSNSYSQPIWGKSTDTEVLSALPFPDGDQTGVQTIVAPDIQSYSDYIYLGPQPEGLNYNVVGTPGDRYEPSFWIRPDYYTNRITPSGIMVLHNLEGNQYGNWAVDFMKLKYRQWNKIDCLHPSVSVQKDFIVSPAGNCHIAFYDPNAVNPIKPRLAFSLWGVQLERGTFPTSYIPTNGDVYTRTTEFVHVSGGFFNNEEATILIETQLLGFSASNDMIVYRAFNIDKTNEINTRFAQNSFTTRSLGLINNSPVLGWNIGSTIKENLGIRILGLSYSRNNIVYVDTGNIAGIDSSSLVPNSLSSLYIGASALGSNTSFNGHIRRFGIFPNQVDNNTLRLLALSATPYSSYDMVHTYDWNLSSSQVAFISLSADSVLTNPRVQNIKKGGDYILVIQQNNLGDNYLNFDNRYIMPKEVTSTDIISLSSLSVTVIRFNSNGTRLYGKPSKYYYWLNEPYTYYGGDGIISFPNPVGVYVNDTLFPSIGITLDGFAPYYGGGGITIIYDGV